MPENEIYALVLKGTVDIQGLVAMKPVKEASAMYISWMVASPENNPAIASVKKYIGVGGHLFAIAINKSANNGFNGDVYGFAKDKDILSHFCNVYGATYLGVLHENHFMLVDDAAIRISEVYDYEESDDEF